MNACQNITRQREGGCKTHEVESFFLEKEKKKKLMNTRHSIKSVVITLERKIIGNQQNEQEE